MAVDPYRFAVDEEAYRHGDHRWLDELDHHAVHAGLPHQRMGTKGLDEAFWLLPDDHRLEELALRRRLITEAYDEVVGLVPGSEPASAEAAALIHDWLARFSPASLDSWDGAVEHPLIRAGSAVQEDLCLMEAGPDGWRLTAAVLCFPAYWRLHEKLDRPQGAIHGPVPHYAHDLERRVSTFFDRLTPGRIVTRRNWGFSRHPLLFVPDLAAVNGRSGAGPDAGEPADEAGAYSLDRLWLRSERQTLRKLPDTGAVLFTIRTQLAPGREVENRPDLAARLLAAMESWSPELIASRGGRHGWYDDVCQWLRGVTSTDLGQAGVN